MRGRGRRVSTLAVKLGKVVMHPHLRLGVRLNGKRLAQIALGGGQLSYVEKSLPQQSMRARNGRASLERPAQMRDRLRRLPEAQQGIPVSVVQGRVLRRQTQRGFVCLRRGFMVPPPAMDLGQSFVGVAQIRVTLQGACVLGERFFFAAVEAVILRCRQVRAG